MPQKFTSAMLMLSVLFALTLQGALAAPGPTRTRERLDADWRFFQEETAANPRLSGVPVTRWRWKADAEGATDAAKMAAPTLDTGGAEWKDAALSEDVFHGRAGFAWFRATLDPLPPGRATQGPPTLHFDAVDDNATVYLNGQRLLHHEGWDEAFDVPLAAAWKADGPNALAVLVENTAGAGGITGSVTLTTAQAPDTTAPEMTRPDFKDRAWRIVHLPHDYVLESPFDPKANTSHGSLPVHTAWYRKTFTLSAAAKGKSVWIDFDGVYRDAMVWLNGRFLGEHKSGYTGFRYDISKIANFGGANTLAVHVDPRHLEGWWYEGGGLYRHVWLNVADNLHVAPTGVFVTSQVQGAEGAPSPAATLTLKTTLANQSAAAQECVLASTVVDPGGKTVATIDSKQTVPAGGRIDVQQQATVPGALLWSVETPRLYRLVTVVQRDGKTVDSTETAFGIRTIRFDPDKGFFLNGKPVKLKGTCNHQDFAGVGIGMPDSLQEWRIKKLQSMGSNAYRCSHNPPTAELLDACDRLGMLVMDENRHLGDTYEPKSSRNTPASDLSDLSELILRDRNHPCVIMWSLCNEEGIQGGPDGERIGSAMKRLVNSLDGTRPITAAMNGGHGGGLSHVLDLEPFNYSPGAYEGYHRAHPEQPIFGSETASTVSTRGIYANDRVKGYVSAYDVNAPPWAQTAEVAWRPIGENDYMAGGFVWTGFDYKGEPTPYGWPCINSHFGILDECGFPKDNYYYYLAWWGDKPTVHLLPHWNWPGKEGQPISVWCYSNCEKVELFLNGQSLGVKEMPRFGHLEWSVPYAPGKLEARAFNGATQAATDKVETAGAPAALRLTTDRTMLMADGEDVTMVEVAVLDAQGRVVPTADDLVSFEVTGAGHVAGVGNGDPSSHEPDKAAQRHAFNGLCMVIVGTGAKSGNIQLTARAPGLKDAELKLSARAAKP